MPVQTGIKNREQYLTRLLQEDEKIAGKDKAYAALSIQSGAEELLIGFEREMKQEAEKEGHAKIDPEAELS